MCRSHSSSILLTCYLAVNKGGKREKSWQTLVGYISRKDVPPLLSNLTFRTCQGIRAPVSTHSSVWQYLTVSLSLPQGLTCCCNRARFLISL